MFNLSGSEVVIILILALVILGPDKLPEAMRRAGRTWAELRKMSSGFQDELRKGFEEPTKEVKKTAAAVKKAAAIPSKKLSFNPLKDPPPKHAEGESVAAADPAEMAAAAAEPSPSVEVEAPAGADDGPADATAPEPAS